MDLLCPYCSGSLEADDSVAGGKAQCPFCEHKFLVDKTGAGLKMDELAVVCPGCSERLVLGFKSIGIKSVCPLCGQHFIVSAPEKAPLTDDTPVAAPVSVVKNNIVNACIVGGMILFVIVCAILCTLWFRR